MLGGPYKFSDHCIIIKLFIDCLMYFSGVLLITLTERRRGPVMPPTGCSKQDSNFLHQEKNCVWSSLKSKRTLRGLAKCRGSVVEAGVLSGMLIRVCFCETPNGRKHDLLSLGSWQKFRSRFRDSPFYSPALPPPSLPDSGDITILISLNNLVVFYLNQKQYLR